jgi:hypothetical protein
MRRPDTIHEHMTTWRYNYREADPSIWVDVWETVALSLLCLLLYVLVVVIFATPEPIIQDEAQTKISHARN